MACLEQEKMALLAFKASVPWTDDDDTSSGHLPTWVEDDDNDDCCSWERVQCNLTTGTIIQLSLNYTRSWSSYDDAHLPNWLLNASLFLPFQELQHLNLSDNGFRGLADNEELAGLEKLQMLDLSGNGFNGSVQVIQGFKSLEILNLSNNHFTNTIFTSLVALKSLKNLSLSVNKLEGNFPAEELAGLENLQMLDFCSNRFNGSAQAIQGLKRFNKLEEIHLDDNNFNTTIIQYIGLLAPVLKILYLSESPFMSGSITSEELDTLRNLELLDLSYSTLKNKFLENMGGMISLKFLSIAFAYGLNGTQLPHKGLCKLRNLQELDLKGNDFVGSVNHCLRNLTSLRALDLSHNQFEGIFDTSIIAGLTSLEYLSLSHNRFQGSFSFHSFANLSKLESFECEDNGLIVEADDYPTWVPSFRLKSLALSGFTFKNDAFPSFLYYQHELRVVQLSNNNLRGEFPIWLLENNTKLGYLNLTNNSFTGPLVLPSHPCLNLFSLILSNNNFFGSIPTNIGVIFPNLRILKLSQNCFEGKIPPSIGNMAWLQVLDLSNNNLSGQIPEHLVTGCSMLMLFKLSYNKLYGKILPTITNITSLTSLYLDHNLFGGNLSDSWLHGSQELSDLDISYNNISGPLPRWLGNLSYLQSLVMRNNHLEGSIPSEFCQLHLLRYLDLSENDIQGSVPSCFSPQGLEHVYLQKNRLEGPMPNAFSNITSLVTLDISDNHISGGIPEWIGGLSSLNALLLKGNQFEGQIPLQLCQLKNLNIMQFSDNFLSDIIVEVEVEFRTKFRSETYKGVVLELMSGIDLSCNKLVGNIPPEIGDLSDIRALNLSHNYLNGQIPPSFSNLRKIESLDLSYNNLTGMIPLQMIELNSLSIFNVAHNNLSGRTPERKGQFATFGETSYEGNPLLCGEPLKKNNCTNSSKAPPSMQITPDDPDDMDMNTFVVSFIASYITVLLGMVIVFYINPYWRRVWFYLIDVCITTTYYFVTDNIHKF
ncbi:PREDICTED: leucine-rich repeat receptor-like protein kinase PEPR1 [Nelumbo nucifera]|uniref:Leucine-rich repeat receptor-like protein kinase PEPR1 n=1 Tax=Nelumbo nucifera TaxID=4432 RepID=A0A1U8PYU1_NELNU|nr:PREDICTED: leucine-rich repeat receptor-like protein kinase PEPR1 [Nelumbo nucifera]